MKKIFLSFVFLILASFTNADTTNIRDDAFWTGTVWFKFTDKGVEVVPLSNEQMHKLAQAQKEYP